jgi:hypothetical protein
MAHQVLRTGLWIGAACVAWMLVMGVTGWYAHPTLQYLFLAVVIPAEVALLVLGLRRTATANGYGGQVVAGTLMAVVAAVVIAAGSLVFTTVLVPDYFQRLRSAHEQVLRDAGRSQAEIDQAIAAAETGETPVSNALGGVIGTIATGVVTSLVAAVFLRRKA